jgi:hypothetical protein
MNIICDKTNYAVFGIFEHENEQKYVIIKSSRAMQKIGDLFEYTDFVAQKKETYNGSIKYINGTFYLYLGYVKHLDYEVYIPLSITSDNTINIISMSMFSSTS